MSNLIKLLPDAVANQIAAGEVVQRPASAVKELLENSIDSGATHVQLIIKDAGKTLIQVIDDGCGMGETDARMCFERHATSKIKETNDLFSIRTKGFRGEAMASIAAVAQVEMKTKLHNQEVGVKIDIEGSKILTQEPVQTPNGTSIAIKNLFFNIPARRNFLKSNQVETRHIIDEFQRVALTHPEVSFKMTHNGSEIFNLPQGTLRQRIVNVFGKKFNQSLVPIDEKTSITNLTGFIGKPEFAKKTRGEQFFFVNKRYIKNSYLNYAVMQAYQDLIPTKSFPSYFIYMDMDPASIDINIHPTKTEIKFEDEKAIYAILNSAVKQSIGKYQVAPSLDFDQETSFNVEPFQKGMEVKVPEIKVNPQFNPFEKEVSRKSESSKGSDRNDTPSARQIDALQQFYSQQRETIPAQKEQDSNELLPIDLDKKIFQVHNRYIYSQIKSGFILIDQQKAHERILYEKFSFSIQNHSIASQKELFPVQLEFSASNFALLKEIWEEVQLMGFDIVEFGKNTISINGVPSGIKDTDYQRSFEQILEQVKNNQDKLNLNIQESLVRAMAFNMSIKKGKQLTELEMNNLIDELFACDQPEYAINGKKTYLTFTTDELDKLF